MIQLRRPSLLLVAATPAVGALAALRPPTAVEGSAPPRPSAELQDGAADAMVALLAEGGIDFEPDRGRFSLAATVATRDDLLEFLLVGPNGSAYESLLATEADPTLLNTAFLALGLEQGRNARWVYVDEGRPVTPEEGERADAAGEWLGEREVRLDPPDGDGVLVYVGWTLDGEDYLFRAEDLIGNLESNRPLPRQRWTYIGSRFIPERDGDGEVFLAALEQNLINIAWFPAGNTLATSTAAVCERQDIWVGNPWLVPEPGTPVRLLFCRGPLDTLPADVAALLPESTTEPEAGAR